MAAAVAASSPNPVVTKRTRFIYKSPSSPMSARTLVILAYRSSAGKAQQELNNLDLSNYWLKFADQRNIAKND
jgi:hypothetical protein